MATNRQQMIENVRRFWIDGVLDNSLHGAALMQLGLRANPEQIQRPWDVKIRRDGENRTLAQDTRIMDVFDLSGGSLLILGEPGSGKTTLLLELTQDLLRRAETQPTTYLPIVFNLSSWAKDKLPLSAWLVEELNIKYQVAQGIANKWVADNSLLLLLDGLDEVSDTVRDDCVDAINAYHRQNPDVPLVVCSRTADYDALSQKLDFHDAVVIEALDNAQIDSYLASFGETMSGLRAQMTSDNRLRALAETPLTLSIMAMAYQELDTDSLPTDLSPDVQRKHLFNTYIDTMFARHSKSKAYQPEEVMGYLSWLAGRMVERRQTLFHIENLQWDWLEKRWQQSLFKLMGRTAYGTIIGGVAGSLATLTMVVLMAVIMGQEIAFYQNAFHTQYGLSALIHYGLVGGLMGMLAGGIPFGLTGLIAYTGDRLSVKGQSSSYPIRTAMTSIGISLFSSIIGGLIFVGIILMFTGSSDNFSLYGRHFYEVSATNRSLFGLEALLFLMEISLLMGLVGGIISILIAKYWHKSQGRRRQIITGIAGLLVGALYTVSVWSVFFSGQSYGIDLFPILLFSLFTGGIGILTGGFRDKVESAERIGWKWSWRWTKVGLAVVLVIIGLDYLSIHPNWYGQIPLNRIISLLLPLGTFAILTGGIAGGLRKSEKVESRTMPNQGVRQSVKTALKVTGAFVILGMGVSLISMVGVYGAGFINNGFTLGNLAQWEIDGVITNFQNAIILGVSLGLVFGLVLGGTDTVVKHLVLRMMLWRNEDIPMNFAKLLDHASSLILLRKVGGGYIFVHRYLLEHVASLETEV